MDLTSKSDRLGTEPIVPLLLKLSIPSIFGMFIQALYNVVDSIYIGHLSKEALSALSLAFPIQMVLIAIGVGTGTGTSSLISRLLGEKRRFKANNAAENAVFLAVIYGIAVGIVGVFFSHTLIKIFTDNLILIDLGKRYIRIILIGSIAMFFPIIANNILRGEGNTFVPMLAMLIGAIINIVLDPFLIFGIGFFPRLGVEGAAYATVFARLLSGIFIAYILFSDKNELKLNMKDFKFNYQIVKEIYRVGLPAMSMQILASVMVAGVNKIVVNYNVVAVAVVGIYFRLQSFFFMPVFGLNQGYIPIIGYNYGHKNPLRIKNTMKYGMLIGFLFTTAGLIIFQLFPEELIRLFNQNPELVKTGIVALKRISLAFPIIGPAIVGSTTFQAVGKGLPSLTLSFLRQFIFLLPVMYLLGKYYGLSASWFAFPISELAAAILMVFWLSSTMKRLLAKLENSA